MEPSERNHHLKLTRRQLLARIRTLRSLAAKRLGFVPSWGKCELAFRAFPTESTAQLIEHVRISSGRDRSASSFRDEFLEGQV